jgi:hypothetical protein
MSGVGVTTIWSPNPAGSGSSVAAGGKAQIGWRTWDMNCYLWDMYWLGATGNPSAQIIPTLLVGMPGGGGATYDGNTVTWTIENTLLEPPEDYQGEWPDRPDIHVPDELDAWVLDQALSLEELSGLLSKIQLGGNEGYVYDGVQVPPHHIIDLRELGGILGPGQSFEFPIPDVAPYQSVLLLGPILQDTQIGVYAEQVTVTPELSTLALLACSGLPLLYRLRRRRK